MSNYPQQEIIKKCPWNWALMCRNTADRYYVLSPFIILCFAWISGHSESKRLTLIHGHSAFHTFLLVCKMTYHSDGPIGMCGGRFNIKFWCYSSEETHIWADTESCFRYAQTTVFQYSNIKRVSLNTQSKNALFTEKVFLTLAQKWCSYQIINHVKVIFLFFFLIFF